MTGQGSQRAYGYCSKLAFMTGQFLQFEGYDRTKFAIAFIHAGSSCVLVSNNLTAVMPSKMPTAKATGFQVALDYSNTTTNPFGCQIL
jgi:hypothetical protein